MTKINENLTSQIERTANLLAKLETEYTQLRIKKTTR
jgi:hypothetical protein